VLTLSEAKDAYIMMVLELSRWNRSQAGRILGISTRMVRYYVSDLYERGYPVKPSPLGDSIYTWCGREEDKK